MTSLQPSKNSNYYPSPSGRFSKIEHASPIVHHFEEIQIRSVYVLISGLSIFMICYYFSEEMGYLLAKPFIQIHIRNLSVDLENPLKTTSFIYTDMKEVFFTYMGISLYISLMALIPILFFHFLNFFASGLYSHEKKQWIFYFAGSFLLFLTGCLFAYYLLLPWLYEFFLSFETNNPNAPQFLNIYLQPKIQEYFFLSIHLILLCGVFAQLPLFLWILLSTSILPEKISLWILQKRNIAYLLTFFLAAWISPPDITSQIVVAIPWILIYEFTIFLILWRKQYMKLPMNRKVDLYDKTE